MEQKPPLPPFTLDTAKARVQAAEDAWNPKDPDRVVRAYTVHTEWRNRAEFLKGRDEIHAFLVRKWKMELDYRLKKELWAFSENRIAVKFQYEFHNDSGPWFRAYGNEQWEFDENGLMRRREASITDVANQEPQRKLAAGLPGTLGATHEAL